jgi:hypothetical protein
MSYWMELSYIKITLHNNLFHGFPNTQKDSEMRLQSSNIFSSIYNFSSPCLTIQIRSFYVDLKIEDVSHENICTFVY